MDILIGLAVVALILLGAYVVTHHKAPATPAGADLANTLAASASASWDALKRDLPSIVSAENAQLKADLASALQEARGLRDRLEATIAQHNADKAAIAARAAAAIISSPELPPNLVPAAVATAQADDVAAVRQLATEIHPA